MYKWLLAKGITLIFLTFNFQVHAQTQQLNCDSTGRKANCKTYYSNTHNLKQKSSWKKGLRHGNWLKLAPNGDPQEVKAYKKGVLIFIEYYVDGKRARREYTNGKTIKYPACGCQ